MIEFGVWSVRQRLAMAGGFALVAVIAALWNPFLAILFGLFTIATLLYRYEVCFDPTTQTYREWRGLLGITKPHVGGFEDVLAVQISLRERAPRIGKLVRSFPVNILWRVGPNQPFEVVFLDFAQAAKWAAEIAETTGCKVWESHELRLIRSAWPEPPYNPSPDGFPPVS